MKSFVGTIITGIVVVALTYILLQRSSAVSTVTKGAVGEYARVANTFQGN